jgi:hypothetical protein
MTRISKPSLLAALCCVALWVGVASQAAATQSHASAKGSQQVPPKKATKPTRKKTSPKQVKAAPVLPLRTDWSTSQTTTSQSDKPQMTLPPARDPQIAVQEEFDAAKAVGTVERWDLFLARHANNPLAARAQIEKTKLLATIRPGQ